MIDTSLKARLARLFSTNVVVRRLGKKRLRVIDTDKLQSSGARGMTSMVDRYSGITRSANGLYSNYNSTYSFGQNRIDLFTDYEAMDMDPIISSALDIYSDECTVKNEENNLLVINSENNEIRKILHNLFYDILNIDYNLWPWIRNLCKYGDFYLHLDIDERVGIVNVQPISAYEIVREEGYDEENPHAVRFIYEGGGGTTMSRYQPTRQEFENFEIAHFRLLSDANFLPYGKSSIEGARKIFKQLMLMEDAMLLQRIMRAPERRIFKIDIGNIPPNEVDQHIQNIINKSKKVPYIDEKTGDYNLKFNLQNMLEDYYLPVRGADSGTTIDTLPGLGNEGQIEDLDYIRNKMMSALKIPKAFLGYDEGVEGKSTLAAEDIRFARTIERMQRIVVSELTKIAIVHLFTQGYTNAELIDFNLELTSPSMVYEKMKVEMLNEKMGAANLMKESKLFSEQYIYENLFNFSHDEYKAMQEQIIEDLKSDFRKEQIVSEGNDPVKTNKSFGTPHDIASMHVATKGENEPGPGRPKEHGTWETEKDQLGRDPFGVKDTIANLKGDMDPSYTHKGSPLSMESVDTIQLIAALSNKFNTKKSNIIKESLKETIVTENGSTLLDENNLLDDENG